MFYVKNLTVTTAGVCLLVAANSLLTEAEAPKGPSPAVVVAVQTAPG